MKFDPDVRRILSEKLQVVFADAEGNLLSEPAEDATRYVVLGPVSLPVTLHGRTHIFQWFCYSRYDGTDESLLDRERLIHSLASTETLPSSVLMMGDLKTAEAPMIRLHSCCATGDIFGSQRCECGPQLRRAMQMIADAGAGAVVYLAQHEGRGIGLFAKAAAYLLQDRGFDTYEANRKLGFPEDSRNFSDAAMMIHLLRGANKPIRLISNNPEKKKALELGGVQVSALVPLVIGLAPYNLRYLQTKRANGHLFTERDLSRNAENVELVESNRAPRETLHS